MSREISPIVEFITARLDEDEMGAVAATRGPWTWTAPRGYPQQVGNSRAVLIAETYTNPAFPAYDIEHIVRHDPNRVFREVKSKRKLLADLLAEKHLVVDDPWYTCAAAQYERDGGTTARDDAGEECDCGRDDRVRLRLLILAATWEDHEDYASLVEQATT